MKNKLEKFCIIAGITLAACGGYSFGNYLYNHFNYSSEPKKPKRETYELVVKYCAPEKQMCEASSVPSEIYIRRDSDAVLLWDSEIKPYHLNQNLASVRYIFQDERLLNILNGELRLIFQGEPKTDSKK